MRSPSCLVFACALTLGCGGTAVPDAGETPDARIDAASSDGGERDVAIPMDAGPEGVVVAHQRELRAVWVASVFRLDFPAAAGRTETQIRDELQGIVDLCVETGLNAIYFQVRPESDALYASTLEPWSRFLTGTQGTDPGYDPLAVLLELAQPAGIEVHAWINPLRGMTTTTVTTASNHVSRTLASAAITYDGGITMNPADTRVRQHVVDVVVDLITHYDVDGVVYDDYFYPYPDDAGSAFPDAASYSAYTSGGGTLSRSDWRRENVNLLVQASAEAIEAASPLVRFGIAPFGIYQPGMPPGVVGLNAYEVISCDSLRWIDQAWVDYLAPQLYWASTSSGQPFGALIDWWASHGSAERPVFASLGAYRLGTTGFNVDEFETEITLTRAAGEGAAGQTWFRLSNLEASSDLRARMASLYAIPARPSRVPDHDVTVAMPSVSYGSTLTVSHPDPVAGYAVYRDDGAGFELTRWVPVGVPAVTLASGSYAISAIDRGGAESLGFPLTVP